MFNILDSTIKALEPGGGGGGGGGTASFRVGKTKTKLQTPDSVPSQPSLTVLDGLQPPVFKVSKDSLLLLVIILLLLLKLSLNRQYFFSYLEA